MPKGSFYHYFESKEAFGLAVARHYHEDQLAFARRILGEAGKPPLLRVKAFFEGARAEMKRRGYTQGCLMCNLTTELADERPALQDELERHWRELSAELAACRRKSDLSGTNLAHLTAEEAADWLLNAWSGALTRMKASGNDAPLRLFIKSVFNSQDAKNDDI